VTPLVDFGPDVCTDYAQALSREWLETNGIGGFASATVAGANTRRYHALLTAATKPPVGRVVMLSKLEETLIVGDERFDLATNEYAGAVHPQGYRLLTRFRLAPFPVFTFAAGGARIEKTVFMVQGSNTTVVTYRLLDAPDRPVRLELRPLIAFRDYHSTTHENGGLNATVEQQPRLASVEPYSGLPRLYFAHDAELDVQGFWYRDFVYAIERERGLDSQEDLFNPFLLRYELAAGKPASVIASTEPQDVRRAVDLEAAEMVRRAQVTTMVAVKDDFARKLALAADQFLTRRGDGMTVMAGYPWFTDWGRDTMIALPGLTLYTGRHDVARSVLLEFSRHVDMGMLPNRFPDSGETAEFNTVDATLWYFEAIRAYEAASGDHTLVEELYPVLSDIIAWHMRGTRYGIRLLDNGLLRSGEPGVQLTWMDAKIGDWVVTPRSGCAVEIQALWFNALKCMEEWAARFNDDETRKRCRTVASLAWWTFNRMFWNEEQGCLYDVINGGPPDATLRPNQVLAASLHHTMLSPERARMMLEVVERDLLTPVGLRSLDRGNPAYRPAYEGDGWSRDSAYHQGTVWPWLLGPFVSAYVRAHGGTEEARGRAHEFLRPLEAHLSDAGLGQISEIFDADAPHRPRGCFAQAWSVAEVLRALCEDVYQLKRFVRAEAMSVSA
jgi:predicted glycogen debranching enzyme